MNTFNNFEKFSNETPSDPFWHDAVWAEVERYAPDMGNAFLSEGWLA
jgi:hypothetical protein